MGEARGEWCVGGRSSEARTGSWRGWGSRRWGRAGLESDGEGEGGAPAWRAGGGWASSWYGGGFSVVVCRGPSGFLIMGTVAVDALAGTDGTGMATCWDTGGPASAAIGTFSLFWPNGFKGGALARSLGLLVSTGDVGCETLADTGRGFLTILCSVLVDSMLALPTGSPLWAFAAAAMASSEGVSRWM